MAGSPRSKRRARRRSRGGGPRPWLVAAATLALGVAVGGAVTVALIGAPPPPPPAAAAAEPAAGASPAAGALPAPAGPGAREPAAAVPPPAWRRHAARMPAAGGRPLIAIVIDDMGLDRRRSARVVDLPAPLTLSYMTYAGDLARQTAAARAAGHELLLHVPMAPRDSRLDPGPNVLDAGLAGDELARRIDWALGRFDGYVGINNHMGSRFTADRPAMARLMAALGDRGLLFLDSRTAGDTVALAVAGEAGVPAVARDVFLDHERTLPAVAGALARLERIARRRGRAVAIGHPADVTIEALADWLPQARRRGLAIVPLSAVVVRATAAG